MDDGEQRLVFVPLEVSVVSVLPPMEDGCAFILMVLLLSSLLCSIMCTSCQLHPHATSYPVIVEAEPVASKV